MPCDVPLSPCRGESWRSVLSQPALLQSERKRARGKAGDQERSGTHTALQPQGSMCFLFGHGQGVQPDGNISKTSPALNRTQLPVRGE